LTKCNLIRRGWKGEYTCLFCGGRESVQLIFECPIARYV
jgi:hypothetical protein